MFFNRVVLPSSVDGTVECSSEEPVDIAPDVEEMKIQKEVEWKCRHWYVV